MRVDTGSTDALDADTEDRLTEFTELLGTAIANAQSREDLTRLVAEQAALRRVATLAIVLATLALLSLLLVLRARLRRATSPSLPTEASATRETSRKQSRPGPMR